MLASADVRLNTFTALKGSCLQDFAILADLAPAGTGNWQACPQFVPCWLKLRVAVKT